MFNEKDVIILAKAILYEPVYYLNSDSWGGYYCNFCNGFQRKLKPDGRFEHDIDCPVLVAKDVMTNINVEEK